MRQIPMGSFVNLVPFPFGQFEVTAERWMPLFYNILLTFPFGFGINFLTRVNVKKCIVASILIGPGLEIAQLCISVLLGYPYRVIDINDALCNTFGVLLGYGSFKLCARLYWVTTGKSMENKDGLSLYLYNVVHEKR
jgi:glycopeptide antibiotics resistance protein